MTLLRTEIVDRVATVTLDDPGRRNAITLPMVEEIEACFDRLETGGEVGAVIVTGAPPAFCAGADLSHLESTGRDGLRRIYEGFLRIRRSPLPTVAAVNGAAVGAGMNLALVCDLRLASYEARFDPRFLSLGLHPGGGHTWMLRQVLGPQGAAAMVLFGEVMDGREAARQGLVWRAVPAAELLGEAQRLASHAAAAPPDLVRRTRETLHEMGMVETHDKAVDRELEVQYWSTQQPAFAHRLASLKKKISRRG